MSEENTQQTQKEEVENNNVVEVPWEEVKELFDVRQALTDIDSRFSELLLNYEKQKAAFLSRSQELEAYLYEQGSALRSRLDMDPEATYELKLPTSHGEKGYFIRT